MFKPSNYTWSWQDLIPSVDLAPAWREVNKSQGNLSLAPYKPSVVIWMLKNHCDNWKTGHSLESLWCFWLNFGKTKTTPGQIPTSKKKKACRCDHRVGVLLRQESQEKKKTKLLFHGNCSPQDPPVEPCREHSSEQAHGLYHQCWFPLQEERLRRGDDLRLQMALEESRRDTIKIPKKKEVVPSPKKFPVMLPKSWNTVTQT